MKKLILVAAVSAAMSGPALAQTVTLYGVLDAGLGYSSVDGSDSDMLLDSGTSAGSRFGIRGTEDLGGGLKANFRLENGLNLDDGKLGQSGRIFGRAAWVGLSGGFGDLRLGRQSTFGFDWFGKVSPFGTSYKQASIDTIFGYKAVGDRIDNSIFYFSPRFGGLQVGIGYSFHDNGQEVGEDSNEILTAGISYDNGPFSLVAAFDIKQRGDANNAAGQNDDVQHFGFGGSYALSDSFTIHAGYGMLDNRNYRSAAKSEKAYMLGLSGKLGAGRWMFTYQRVDGRNENELASDTARDGIAVGYDHALSKRTSLYVYGSQYRKVARRADDATRLADSTQFGFGLRHSF